MWLRKIFWTMVRITRIRRPTGISWVQKEEGQQGQAGSKKGISKKQTKFKEKCINCDNVL